MDVKKITELLADAMPGDFVDVARFNTHQFGACHTTGTSPYWEMHPETDEFFYVIEGALEFTLLRDDQEQLIRVPQGAAYVVPRGLWHRPSAPSGATFIYFTPGETLHSEHPVPGEPSDA